MGRHEEYAFLMDVYQLYLRRAEGLDREGFFDLASQIRAEADEILIRANSILVAHGQTASRDSVSLPVREDPCRD